MNNLFANISDLPEELTEVLVESNSIRIERIVSHCHASPEGSWYDQEENEWVVVLKVVGYRNPVLRLQSYMLI